VQMAASLSVLTIGHSTHPWKHFASLLHGAGATAVADVRTSPCHGATLNSIAMRYERNWVGKEFYMFSLAMSSAGVPRSATSTATAWLIMRRWQGPKSLATD
jgi:hypothetical protein